jgi:Domain of unknown function (DUF4383)
MSYNPPAASRARSSGAGLGGLTNPNRTFGFLFGAVYVLVGLVGFFVTRGVGFAATQGKTLIIFNVNPLHNLVHIAIGAVFILGALGGERPAAVVNAVLGAAYLVVGVAGLFVIGHSLNILAINQADNGLHFASALLALGFGAYGLSQKGAPRTATT